MERDFIAYTNKIKDTKKHLANFYIKSSVDAESAVDAMRTNASELIQKQSLPLQIVAFNEQYYTNLQQKYNPYTKHQMKANVGTSLKRFQKIALSMNKKE